MTDAIYWIWLQSALGEGSLKADRVIRSNFSPEQLFRMTDGQLEETGLFSQAERIALRKTKLEDSAEQLRRANELGCTVLTPGHPHFPENLTYIVPAPCVLYVLGDLCTLSEELLLAMVGTRDSDQYGERAAYCLARDLTAAGCTVASGLAVGIDCAAHAGALSLEGRTIGFLGCGLDVDYPKPSASLKERILAHGGALISEFLLGTPAFPRNFNIRNRLLSGICAGAVVVQAPARSGALNTASHALEQGKEVFAVPGGIFDHRATGCNRLIKDGAKMVLNGYSILEEFIGRFPASIDERQIKTRIEHAGRSLDRQQRERVIREEQAEIGRKASEQAQAAEQPAQSDRLEIVEGLSGNARKIYEVLCFEPADCYTISQRTELLIMEIMSGLTELEINGLARPGPGNRYAVESNNT